jgi:hypothetical protein
MLTIRIGKYNNIKCFYFKFNSAVAGSGEVGSGRVVSSAPLRDSYCQRECTMLELFQNDIDKIQCRWTRNKISELIADGNQDKRAWRWFLDEIPELELEISAIKRKLENPVNHRTGRTLSRATVSGYRSRLKGLENDLEALLVVQRIYERFKRTVDSEKVISMNAWKTAKFKSR